MDRTPLKSKYLRGLADLNDHLCFYLFASQELRGDLSRLRGPARDLFLPDVYGDNDYARRINIKVDEVDSFESERDRFTFGSYVSTSYELVSSFLEDSLTLLEKSSPSFFQRRGRASPEEKYWRTLAASGCNMPPDERRWTLQYIRLRRNGFVHLHENPKQALATCIQSHGVALNAHWSGSIRELDFSSMDVQAYRERESIDLLLILRVLVEDLDAHLAPQLDRIGLLELVAKELFESPPSRINDQVAARRVQKLRGAMRQRYNASYLTHELDQTVRRIGVRVS